MGPAWPGAWTGLAEEREKGDISPIIGYEMRDLGNRFLQVGSKPDFADHADARNERRRRDGLGTRRASFHPDAPKRVRDTSEDTISDVAIEQNARIHSRYPSKPP